MSHTLPTYCWSGYGDSVYVWMITGPMITAIGVNCIFLINIIRILITKLRLTVTVEMTQIRKAMKATALLFPLLGISHLLFCFNPGDNGQLESVYMITNAFLQSSQGIFVSVLYCFLNTEVQTVVRNVYLRASMRRSANPNLKFSFVAHNPSNRRMRFLSQTSASFVSNWESGPHHPSDKTVHKQCQGLDLEMDQMDQNNQLCQDRSFELC
ncbi:unnamed protein product [Oppiella nova]|uniref:G-protein coupled receptors family 2 profile 2 domain-containing protein n=1 Tax=Oppiella nova TaxID=334625 RepID=A0A7R9LF25_9ACAR|nr:unnamed protein product [Oppiella nova]CAG2162900.1 unnamed protein product [Oppiella nova]